MPILKIEDTFYIKNRGYVVSMEIPTELRVSLGDHIKQGENEWEILGAEKFHTGCFGGECRNLWGFLIKSVSSSSDVPERAEAEILNKK